MRVNRVKKNKKRMYALSVFMTIAIFIVIFAIIMGIYTTVASHPFLSVLPLKHIIFYGNKHLTDDELREITGIYEYDSLLTISNKEVSTRLLTSPWIRSVAVRKEFPDTLSVVLKEAVPFALLDLDNHLFLIDERGELLEELKGDLVPFLPIITGDPFKEREGFSEALNIARLMNDKGFSQEKNYIEIIAQKPHEVTVIVDGTVVKMGAGGYEGKLKRLIELEGEIETRDIHVDYIDLRFEHKAIVKPVMREETQ